LISIENIWLRRFVNVVGLCFKVNDTFSNEVILKMVKKNMGCHGLLALVEATIINTTFDL
jgi:3-methyladenine DNA glycosylase AlkD